MTDDTAERITRLRATRDRLEAQLKDPATPPYSVAPLSNQLRLADKEIDRIQRREAAKDDGLPTTPELATWIDFFRFRREVRRAAFSDRHTFNEWGRREAEIHDEWRAAGFVVPPYPARDDTLTLAEHRAATERWGEECRAELVRCLAAVREKNQPQPEGATK